MNNHLTPIRAKIKPYYNKSRNKIILRLRHKNRNEEFQSNLTCSYPDFMTDKAVQIQIDDQIHILAECLYKFENTDIVRKEYYKIRNSQSTITEDKIYCFHKLMEEFEVTYKDTLAHSHLRNVGVASRSIKRFTGRPMLSCQSLTSKFLNQYTNYLVTTGIENNTIKGYLKRIKRVVRYAHETYDIDFSVQFELITQLKDKANFVVFLSKSEVAQFAQVKTKTPGEKEVKNGFLFRCYTGIRFSEMPYIDLNNLDDGVLSFYIPKSSNSHQIPLNRKALELLKKVKMFNPISQQKENKYIKELAKRAGINRPVQKVKLSGSVSTVETFPKWKLCSSHTARRTWARIAYDAGVDILKISRYIGHSDISTTLKYIGHKDTDFDELKELF